MVKRKKRLLRVGFVAMVLLAIASLAIYNRATLMNGWVTGQCSECCYLTGEEHGNIEYQIYHDSLDQCNKRKSGENS